MIEGSGSGSRAKSGSIPQTNGSGSRRPKNMWIRWIRIRIRIRNTDSLSWGVGRMRCRVGSRSGRGASRATTASRRSSVQNRSKWMDSTPAREAASVSPKQVQQ